MPSRRKHIRRKSLRRTKSRRGGVSHKGKSKTPKSQTPKSQIQPGTPEYLKKAFEERRKDYWDAHRDLTRQRNTEIDLHRQMVSAIVEAGSSDASDGNLSDTIYSRNADRLNAQIHNLYKYYLTEQEIEDDDARAARAAAQQEANRTYYTDAP
jgi:hypothetical protein